MKLSLYRMQEFWLFAASRPNGFEKLVTERLTFAGLISEQRVLALVPAVLVRAVVLMVVVIISPIPIGSGAT